MAARAPRVLGVVVRWTRRDVGRLAAVATGLAIIGLATGLCVGAEPDRAPVPKVSDVSAPTAHPTSVTPDSAPPSVLASTSQVVPPTTAATPAPTPAPPSAPVDPPGAAVAHVMSGRPAVTGALAFGTPHFFPSVPGDTYYNTVGPDGGIVATGNDSYGADGVCGQYGSDIVILHASGADPAHLSVRTVNCMTSFGPIGGGHSPDGCSWKTGGITRVGRAIYVAVARQLRNCSYGKEANGLQPSFDASIIKSVDGGHTWTNPWGLTSSTGAAPTYDRTLKRYRAMFPGQTFSAPFFIQYGPGNTQTVDGANKYLYAVSNDGYAYNGSYLRLARVPLDKIQNVSAWQFYHGVIGGAGRYWTSSPVGATRVLQDRYGLSQPAIQYVPALKRYVLVTFSYTRAGRDFPTPAQTPYTHIRFYSAPKPWGPWTKVFDHGSQRTLWCSSAPCPLTSQPGSQALNVGRPDDWLGLYDPVLVQKFLFTRPLTDQTLLTSGDFKNPVRFAGENLYRMHAMPFDLTSVLRT